MRIAVIVAIAIAGCRAQAAPPSCDDELAGVYRDGDGARWMILDNGPTLEGFPLFDDYRRGSDLELAPRVLDVRRGPALAGDVKRRYTRAGVACTSRVTAKITACRGDALELAIGVPQPPLEFEPCRAAPRGDTRVERWTRE